MKRQRVSGYFIRHRLPKRCLIYGLVGLLTALLWLPFAAAVATEMRAVSLAQAPDQLPAQTPDQLSIQGQQHFEAGDYSAAAQAWRLAADWFAAGGNTPQQVRNLNNLVQAYQQLGQWPEAESTLAQSLALLASGMGGNGVEQQALWGQTWTVQGGLALAQDRARQALEAFETAATYYQSAGQAEGVLRSQVNQARALRAMGLYRRAIGLLETTDPALSASNPSMAAAAGLSTLGELYRIVGYLELSRTTLEQGLAMAQQLGDSRAMATTQLSLANTAVAAGEVAAALAGYQQVAATAQMPELAVRAGIAQLSLFARQGDLLSLRQTLGQLTPALATLPAGQLRTYALIDAANALMATQDEIHRDQVLAWLTEAVDQAKTAHDARAESYALGALGKVYQHAQQLADATRLTQTALALATRANALEVSYLWNAQLGDLQRQLGNVEAAIANYAAAVQTLETLRQDLVAIDDDVRYNFRETVEPVYRHLVDLLTLPGNVNQPHLQQARAVIEALQLAELENFFREACLPVSENIDQVVDNTDQPTAVLYPIILSDRLEVVLKLPQQPLTHYSAPVSQAELEAKLLQFRRNVELPHTLNQVQAEAKALYHWLLEPAMAQLQENRISTLVFVLDGALRNIPMGLLYDGERYLIEDFGVAIAPGLQLVDPKALTDQRLSVMVAGISEVRDPFPALPFVAEEVKEVEAALSSQVLLNQTFTVDRLETLINTSPFPVVHLATHGQFSSDPEGTFILAWDNQIPMTRLNSILRNSEQSRQSAIELLVLSACQTATGDSRAALGLAGVAVRAGARSTIASLWNLDDETTALVMNQFYRALNKPGITRAEALRQAQLSILRNPRYEHPRHWAPYVLIGNWL